MQYKKTYKAIFNLMQDTENIMANIDEIKQEAILYGDIKLDDLDKIDERFYNFLLIFLRNTPDNLWINEEHRLKIYEIIRVQLDNYSPMPTPFIKDKFYG